MSEHQPDLRTWIAGVVFLGLAGFIGTTLPNFGIPKKLEPSTAKPDKPISSNAAENRKPAFSPPGDDEIPKNEFGDAVRLGERIFMIRKVTPGSSSATPCNAQTVIWISDASPMPPRSGRPMWHIRRTA